MSELEKLPHLYDKGRKEPQVARINPLLDTSFGQDFKKILTWENARVGDYFIRVEGDDGRLFVITNAKKDSCYTLIFVEISEDGKPEGSKRVCKYQNCNLHDEIPGYYMGTIKDQSYLEGLREFIRAAAVSEADWSADF